MICPVSLRRYAAGAALAALSVAPLASAQGHLAPTLDLPQNGHERCALPNPSESSIRAVQAELHRRTGPSAQRTAEGGFPQLLIPTVYHIITRAGGGGDVSDQTVQDQHDVLNAAFAPWGIQFDMVLVQRVPNNAWYGQTSLNGNTDNAESLAMKQALAVDPSTTLNLYFNDLPDGLLGYAQFPTDWDESSPRWGVVNLTASMPGGSAAPYNGGDTATHEVGHALGLYHTFQGGCHADNQCASAGDRVCDTPSEASPNYNNCNTNRNTCSGAGNDPVKNFMDYSTDACMDRFTEGQATRVHDIMAAFKPTLYQAALVDDEPGTEGTLQLSTAKRGFGSVDVGTSRTRKVIVSNPPGAAVTVSSITLPDGFSTEVSPPVAIGPGASLAVGITFTPTAGQRYRGDLVLETAGGATYTVLLVGKGVGGSVDPGPGPGPGPGGVSGVLRYDECPEPPSALAAGNGECRVRLKFTNEGPDEGRYTLFVQMDGPGGVSRLAARTEVEPAVGKTVTRRPRIQTRASDPAGTYTLTALAQAGSVNSPSGDAVTLGSLELVKPGGAALRTSEALAVFPNPAAAEATLRFASADARATLAVYDALGREVARPIDGPVGGPTEVSVDVSGLPAGLYVARLLVEGRAETVRFSVIR